MVREFEGYIISKEIYALIIIDEIKLSDVTNDLDHRLKKLTFRIFYFLFNQF